VDFDQKKEKKERLVLEVVVGVDVEVGFDDVRQVQEGVDGHPEGRVTLLLV
jgi:hypothetical protein